MFAINQAVKCGVRATSSFRSIATLRNPMIPTPGKQCKICSPEEAVRCVQSDDKVYLHMAASCPVPLVNALTETSIERGLKNVEMVHLLTEGTAPYTDPKYKDVFSTRGLFLTKNTRKAVNSGNADYVPVFFNMIPQMFKQGILKVDCCFIQVSPPDENGMCTLGIGSECVPAALSTCKYIVAEINDKMPRTYGDVYIHISNIDYAIKTSRDIPLVPPAKGNEQTAAIGKIIAENLIKDGATLQVGIGTIPDAVLACLHNHKDLGVHTEMFTDGMVDLIKSGAVNNSKKIDDNGKSTTTFVMGTQKTYEYVRENPLVTFREVGYTNDPFVIMKQPGFVALNSCIEMDLTGQIVSDSIGTSIFSGFGGQVDYLYGALRNPQGVPIIAIPSTTPKGASKIVPFLRPGAGVVTSRAHVRYIVTEYGIADLWGKSLRERARALINISHPNHRQSLYDAAVQQLGLKL
ncbi:hypothetical protein WA158_004659 [Blastocystis sp. Blastoise]